MGSDWLRPLRPLGVPGDQVQLQGRQGDRRQEDGQPPLAQVERDGRGGLRAQQPLVVDSFKNCEGLSRIAFLDGNTAVLLGKVTTVVAKSDMPAEEVKTKKK